MPPALTPVAVLPSAMPRTPPLGPALAAVVLAAGCGGLGGDPPVPPPVVKGPDGQRRHVVERSPYRAVYDRWGRLETIEHDSNGDGRADRITRHQDGAKSPHRVEIDSNFDGRTDRWEDFDVEGKVRRFALADADGRPQLWTVVNEAGDAVRYEYDRDRDGRTERAEVVVEGRIGRVELDTDRDGRFDRWQEWKGDRVAMESLDTDGDGRPDRRLRYGPDGRIKDVERLDP